MGDPTQLVVMCGVLRVAARLLTCTEQVLTTGSSAARLQFEYDW